MAIFIHVLTGRSRWSGWSFDQGARKVLSIDVDNRPTLALIALLEIFLFVSIIYAHQNKSRYRTAIVYVTLGPGAPIVPEMPGSPGVPGDPGGPKGPGKPASPG